MPDRRRQREPCLRCRRPRKVPTASEEALKLLELKRFSAKIEWEPSKPRGYGRELMTENMESAIEKLRATFDAFNRGDLDSAGEWVDQEVEIGRTPFIDPPARGKTAMLEFMRPTMFERQTTELLAAEVHGSVILAKIVFHAVGKGSGVEVSQTNFQLFTIRDGLFVKWEVFFNQAEAEAAVAAG